jgi:hypothetical protein
MLGLLGFTCKNKLRTPAMVALMEYWAVASSGAPPAVPAPRRRIVTPVSEGAPKGTMSEGAVVCDWALFPLRTSRLPSASHIVK